MLRSLKTSRCFSDNIILVCAVCVVLSFLSQIFKVSAVVNLIYAFSLALVFGCYFLSTCVSNIMLLLFPLIGVSAIANGIENTSDFYSHILIVVCTFICIEVGVGVRIGIETYKKISMMFLATGIILVVSYYFGPLRNSYFKWTDVICLNFPNPNAAGLWLTCIFVLLFYFSFIYKTAIKLLFLAVAVGILPIIVATQSRNSYLACVLLVVGAVVAKMFKIRRVPNWMLAVLACLPIIVFFFYMFVIVENMAFWQEIFAMDNIDKGLGTRESIWQSVLDNFWHCFLFGDYKKYYDWQLHNSLMTIYCRFGAIVTTAVCVLLYKALKKLQDESSFYAALSLGAVLFTGCFEASLFIGIAGLYLMLLVIPACASVEKEQL